MAALVLSTLPGGAIMIWYSCQMDALFVEMVEEGVRILGVAEESEAELAKRNGFLSHFFIDGDRHWLDKMVERRCASCWRSYWSAKS